MRKRTKLIIGILIIILVGGFGIAGGLKMNEQQTRDRQIEFLKAHEDEMTGYIKSQSDKITSVTYNWDTMREADRGAFTAEALSLRVDIHASDPNISDNYSFVVETTAEKNANISDMYVVNFGQ